MSVTNIIDFAALVSPTSIVEFFDKYWEQQPLHQSPVNRNRFDSLVGVDDVETLATIGLSLPDALSAVLAARCVNNKPDYWEAPVGVGPNVSIYALLHAFEAGYSIVLNSVDRYWSPLGELCRQIESTLQQPVAANLYYSPESTQGFPAHFDKFDVLVIQISGQKTWDLFEPEPGALSGSGDPWEVPSATGEPHLRAVLKPGDILYLPRGWSHRVCSQSAPSLHVTFGIRSLRWADLVMRAAQHAVDTNNTLQQSIPLHRGRVPENINVQVRGMLDGLVMPDEYDPYGALMGEVLKGRPPSLVGQSRSMVASAAKLDPSTMLRRRPGLAPLVTYQSDDVTIRFAGNGVTTTARFGNALEFVARTEQFTVGELSKISGNNSTALARALIVNGLLTIELTQEDLSEID